MQQWHLTPAGQPLAHLFGSLESIFALSGERVTSDMISNVIRVEHAGVRYYVKRYNSAGKGLRRFFGKPRVQGEWENLQHFANWGIPTAPLIGFGLEKNWRGFFRGAIVTQEIKNTQDLAQIADDQRLLPEHIASISAQLAHITRTLHQHRFVHNDLKWRNVLINDQQQVYLIDCPLGGFWRGGFLAYRIVKDLKTLDNRAKKHLRRSQRMRFFLDYCDTPHLTTKHKHLLRRLLQRKSRRHDKQSNLGLVFSRRF